MKMGYEHGTIFIYQRKFWFFEGYSTNSEMRQTLKLRGVDGVQVEALESECFYLLSPNEVDYNELEKQKS
jgi:hypothetical protein